MLVTHFEEQLIRFLDFCIRLEKRGNLKNSITETLLLLIFCEFLNLKNFTVQLREVQKEIHLVKI